MTSYRISHGSAVDASKEIAFTFNGRTHSGYRGDTLASALLANGIRLIGRSFKYHRPRGFFAAGVDEPNGIVQLENGLHTIPNEKATTVELYDRLTARSVNAWPSPEFDLMSVTGVFGRFLPAGFYYKTFMWPDWHLFEPAIRRAAGLGHAPKHQDPETYDKRYAEYDILVVGGGAAGIVAALNAGRSGARVLLVEMSPQWGGHVGYSDDELDGVAGSQWVDTAIDELKSMSNVCMLNRTMAFGYYDHNLIGLVERLTDHKPISSRRGPRQRLWKVRARHTILAQGAFERPLVFANNDRPGVMLANAAEAYLSKFGVAVGQRVLVATNNDSAYGVAKRLEKAGIKVIGVVDSRETSGENVPSLKTKIFRSTTISDVRGTKTVKSVELHELQDDGTLRPGTRQTIECDTVLTSGGWSPAVHLHSQSGGRLQFDNVMHAFTPGQSAQNSEIVGAACGVFDLQKALTDAADIGHSLGDVFGKHRSSVSFPNAKTSISVDPKPLWYTDTSSLSGRYAKSWVDFQNDVTASDVKLAIRESFQSVEHVKRYTTLGMASDQGKTSNVNGIGIMSKALGLPLAGVGTTKFRPPYDPIPIGVMAGRRTGQNYDPLRRLPAQACHLKLGAVMEDYGGWNRPAYYFKNGETEREAIEREALAVRKSAGLFDASPLGKIEVRGPDAAEFLNRIYINNMKSLKPGRCRYGLMLDENGVVFDDGVLACLGENHYLVGTTSGHANDVANKLEEWLQCEWLDLKVATENMSTAWAVMNINGPNARNILEHFDHDMDLSPEALPHMRFTCGKLSGVPCRIQRVSFSGELSYEVSVPSDYGSSFFEAILKVGAQYDIVPFGVETLMLLRMEKGFLHLGSDTDGTTIPQDLGFGPIINKKKADFIGRRSLMRPDSMRDDRRQLVGLDSIDDQTPFTVGAHIISEDATAPCQTQGWVTSSGFSPNLSRPVAMALIESGRSRENEIVKVWDLGRARCARITSLGPFDPKGERLHA